jgi:phosphoribosylglycinamide formyltransferase-1
VSDGARIAFLLSGTGSTLQNLLERIEAGEVPGRVVVAIADRPAAGLEHARRRGIPAVVVDRASAASTEAFHDAIDAALLPHRPDLVVLGGFLSVVRVPPALRGRILNVHPSLLPRFGGRGMYGERVHRAVLAARETRSGCTVHVVTDEVDAGPILGQAEVPVLPDDTAEVLAHRVQAAERRLYPEVIRRLLTPQGS